VLSRNLHTLAQETSTLKKLSCVKPDSSKTFSLENPKSFEKLEEA
jgi:hypothetical protein